MKQCTNCKQWKSKDSFYKNCNKKDGVNPWCKSCMRGWDIENRKERNEYRIEYRKNNIEKNREKQREYSRKYQANNLPKVVERIRKWCLENGKGIEKANKRRSRETNRGNFTGKEWLALKNFYNNTCLCCKRSEPEIKLTADHVLPLAIGGDNTISNIQPLCKSCNSKKYTKYIDYR